MDTKRLNEIRIEKVQEWAKAESEGRLVVLPCKWAQMLYRISVKKIVQEQAISYHITMGIQDGGKPGWVVNAYDNNGNHIPGSNGIDKTVFRTRAEAEAALAERKKSYNG